MSVTAQNVAVEKGHKDNGDYLGTNDTLKNAISADGTPELGKKYTVQARCGAAVKLKKGQMIQIINTHGTQVCDTWMFNEHDMTEFMSMEHARQMINRVIPVPGDILASNQRRAIGTLLTDTSPGVHDTLMAACDLFRYKNFGIEEYHDNCADNMRMALAAIGLRVGEVPQPLNLWMNIPIKPDYTVDWKAPVSKAGDYVEIRAEMDSIVVMSACPQDVVEINALNPVDVHFIVKS